MNKTNILKIKTADARIELRVWKEDKKLFMAKAKEIGIPLTELIIRSLKGQNLPDRKNQEELFYQLSSITKEINMIGKNINQATIAIHQINNNSKMEIGDFRAFIALLGDYNIKQEELKLSINRILFNEAGI